MKAVHPFIHVARVVIEAATPLALHTGKSLDGFDSELVRDANGLPAIPGTAIAGVLRHLWQTRQADSVKKLFGDVDDEELPSRISVSHACVHDMTNRPVTGLISQSDDLLDWLREAQPVLRDNVKLTHRGAALDSGKFDRVLVPKGCRFTFEIRLLSTTAEDADWSTLLSLLVHPRFRLGAVTRSGLGAISIVALHTGCFDLHRHDQFKELCLLSPDLREVPERLSKQAIASAESIVQVSMSLASVTPWRIGADKAPALSARSRQEKPSDGRLMSEPVIVWENDRGHRTDPQLVIPGSSLKGALVHRTRFHYYRLGGQFAEDLPELFTNNEKRPPALQQLFGDVEAKKAGNAEEQAWAGAVTFNDVYLDPSNALFDYRTHNSIDRFTGGTRDTALFSDELVVGTGFKTNISIDISRLDGLPSIVKKAFDEALNDLARGMLALGAGASKGQGVFEGSVQWNEAGINWLNSGDSVLKESDV